VRTKLARFAHHALVKGTMIERAAAVYVLADSSKLGRSGSQWWPPLPESRAVPPHISA
jgi:DeoR/GlpR family transcriptional regulator of sugar metabolism